MWKCVKSFKQWVGFGRKSNYNALSFQSPQAKKANSNTVNIVQITATNETVNDLNGHWVGKQM